MDCVEFDSQNLIFTAAGCRDLPARLHITDADGNDHVNDDGPRFYCIETRWVPNLEERKALLDGGAIVMKIRARNPPPSMLHVIKDGKVIE